MKIVYNYSELVGNSICKYGILFSNGLPIEISDQNISEKLLKSPYFSEFVEKEIETLEIEEIKPKRKYNKRKKEEKVDEAQAETEAETAPEIEEKTKEEEE